MKASFMIDVNDRLQIQHEPESNEEGILLRLWQINHSATEIEQARTLLEKLLGREVHSITEGIEAAVESMRQEVERGDAENAKAIDDAWDALREAMPHNPERTLAAAITHLDEVRAGVIRRLEDEVRGLHKLVAGNDDMPEAPAAPQEKPKRRHHISEISRAQMALNARLSPQSAQAVRELAAKGHGPEEIASRKWVSAAGKVRRFNIQMIKNVLKRTGAAPEPVAIAAEASEQAPDDKEDRGNVRPPDHPHCRGVYTPIALPWWARAGRDVPAPSYAGPWSWKPGRINTGRVHPGGKFSARPTDRTEC